MKKLLFKKHTSYRSLPVNLKQEDLILFKRELEREIPNSYLVNIKKAIYLNQSLYKYSGFLQFSKYTNFGKLKITDRLKNIIKYNLTSESPTEIETGIWVLDNKSHVYGHFLNDTMCRLIMIPEECRSGYKILIPENLNLEWIIDIFVFFDIEYEIMEQNKKYLIYNLLTTTFPARPGNFNKEILKQFKKESVNKLGEEINNFQSKKSPMKRIWIDRGTSRRNVYNMEEIKPILDKYNFHIIDFKNFSISEKIKIMNDVEILAGNHGSGLANMTFMNEKANILDIRDPNDRYKNAFFSQASELNLNYFYMEREASNPGSDILLDDIRINPQKLNNVLNKIIDYSG